MSTGSPAVSTENTLRKVGSHLRWFMEKSGVNPEKAAVCIVVDSHAERDSIAARFAAEFVAGEMQRVASTDGAVVAGVKIFVTVKEKA